MHADHRLTTQGHRRALAGALLALFSLVQVGSVTAATTRPVCRLINDAAFDAGLGVSSTPAPYQDPGLDITSADLATTGDALTIVIRLRSYPSLDPSSPLGRAYLFEFAAPNVVGNRRTAPKQAFMAIAIPSLGPPRATYGLVSGNVYLARTDANVDIDVARGVVRAQLHFAHARSDTAGFATRAVAFGNFELSSYRMLGDPTGLVALPTSNYTPLVWQGNRPYATLRSDTAVSHAIYLGGSPSCVTS